MSTITDFVSITRPDVGASYDPGSTVEITGSSYRNIFIGTIGMDDTFYVQPIIKVGENVVSVSEQSNTYFEWIGYYVIPLTACKGPLNISATQSTATPVNREINVSKDSMPPGVTITSPVNHEVIMDTTEGVFNIEVTGTASDNCQLSSIEFKLDDEPDYGHPINISGIETEWGQHFTVNTAGVHTIFVRSKDSSGLYSIPAELTVVTVDNVGPTLTFDNPYIRRTWTTDGMDEAVDFTGTASDETSLITRIEWSIGDGQWNPAIHDVEKSTSWSFRIEKDFFSGPGLHQIEVRAFDEPGEQSIINYFVEIDIALPFELEDLGPIAYLQDLMILAKSRIEMSTGDEGRPGVELGNTFHQPFAGLVDVTNLHSAWKKVQQVRIAVEVLRSFLNDSSHYAEYCEIAYQTLLVNLGTSYEAMRLIRTASTEERYSLAARLGIDVSQLNQFFLQPSDVTEANLQQLFGLADTTQNPLAVASIVGSGFHTDQQAYLRTRWREQDQRVRDMAHDKGETPVPIIDPDVIDIADIIDPKPGDPVFDLWDARVRWVEAEYLDIKTEREPQATEIIGFDHIVTIVLGDIVLEDLNQAYENGDDIEPDLTAYDMDLQAFFRLLRTRRLAETLTVTESEWQDVYDILVQVRKIRKFAEWVELEKADIILGPDHFKVSEEAAVLSQWRASWQTRRDWENTLTSRLKQTQALTDALRSAVSATEASALPLLRDKLITGISHPDYPYLDMADWLTQRLSISFKYSGDQQITRIEQAIETLQDIFFALRTETIQNLEPLPLGKPITDWRLATDPVNYTETDFDTEWKWMGAYGSWRAAMSALGYPENYLYPTLRDVTWRTEAFEDLMDKIRLKWRLTPTEARQYAKDYSDAIGLTFDITDQLTKDKLLATKGWREKSRDHLSSYYNATEGGWDRTAPSQMIQYLEAFYFVPMQLGLALQKSSEYLAALDWFQLIYAYELPSGDRKIFYGLIAEESLTTEYRRSYSWLLDGLDPYDIARDRANAYTSFTLISIVRCLLAYGDAEFTRETNESIPHARRLYMTAQNVLNQLESQSPIPHPAFQTNPVLRSLRLHADLHLQKIRTGRNVAGMERVREPLAMGELAFSNKGLVPVESGALMPTPYRYSALVERSKELVTIAQQMEAAFLSAVEKRDSETYTLLHADHDIELSRATVDLQDLRITEANGGIVAADLQTARAQTQYDTYQGWIDAGKNQYERNMLQNYRDLKNRRNWVARLDATLTYLNAANTAASNGFLGTGLSFGWGSSSIIGGAAAGKAIATYNVNETEMNLQINSFNASFERRNEEWDLQQSLAQKDKEIGVQQVALAQVHKQVVAQERAIARLQVEHAEEVVAFLNNKFTNIELYEWMSGVLSEIYSYFLQQASSMALLAQRQLAFERQERPPAYIQGDYWAPPSEGGTASTSDGEAPDRRGLTGSARLLRDIHQLDLYAFNTNKRKLQLVQTYSLAQLVPYELQRFRESGVLSFTTPMSLLDQAFPGHYLRLVKRVRISVIALIPPTRGLRATLTAAGLSRVVTGSEVFRTTGIRRPPEMIAFTSPSNATGLFELQPEGELLMPFEGMGVDTSWELEMPKAANAFDYGSLADVLLTVEYTALYNPDYRHQVIRELDESFTSERAFSFKQDFPDLWYHFNNRDNTAGVGDAITLEFETHPEEFPPNLNELKIDHVLLYFAIKEDAEFEIAVQDLQFDKLEVDPDTPLPLAATTREGVISTRRGNASSWQVLLGKPPMGKWTLILEGTTDLVNGLEEEHIEDILFVISYTGETPPWPI